MVTAGEKLQSPRALDVLVSMTGSSLLLSAVILLHTTREKRRGCGEGRAGAPQQKAADGSLNTAVQHDASLCKYDDGSSGGDSMVNSQQHISTSIR